MAYVLEPDRDRECNSEPFRQPPRGSSAAPLRTRLRRLGLWLPNQIAGRRWPMGCVSLEVTQRCNLDCTLCYLSEHSEAVRDVPMSEILRRIELIHTHYGPGTDIQISGGEPTLRKGDELVQIVEAIRRRGMRASLFTNGIRATRELLAALARAGLTDVAFHVDTTQNRQGYPSEASLDTLRDAYIERARGLGLTVFFNTTIHDGNVHEVEGLAAYFVARAGRVGLASFQLQAQTGRGTLGAREEALCTPRVIEAIQRGLGTPISFDRFLVGHPQCNRYAAAMVIGGRVHDAFADAAFAVEFMRRTARVALSRGRAAASMVSLVRAALVSLPLALRTAAWLGRFVWNAKVDLLRSGGRVRKISFVIHNFMDAHALDPDRVASCVFMAMTQDGPLSMCAYNAERDEYLLQPIATGSELWDPLGPRRAPEGVEPAKAYPIRWLKGRARAEALRRRGPRAD